MLRFVVFPSGISHIPVLVNITSHPPELFLENFLRASSNSLLILMKISYKVQT